MPPAHDRNVLANLPRGRHACLVYDDPLEAITSIAPYIATGLRQNERCLYVCGEHDLAVVRENLARAGIPVEKEEARGALSFADEWQVSFPGGEFEPVAMIGFVREAISQALRDGFAGVRLTAEMTWALQLGLGHNRLIHYEALGNGLYPHEPLVAVCMYNRSRFPAEICQDAIRVHPLFTTGSELVDNFYYELPDSVIHGTTAQSRLDWMVQQLERTRRAEASNQARDELFSVLAHELRNPLMATRAYAQSALARLDRAGSEGLDSLRRTLEGIVRQTRRQARLIENVLEGGRNDPNELVLNVRELDLAELLREVATLMRGTRGREIRDAIPERAAGWGDPVRLEQVVTNLLDNAIKFSPEGSPIELSLAAIRDGYELSVRDFGVGIAPCDRERIFERYERCDPRKSGLGLGLYLCRRIVRRHGGEILVEAPEDGGTRMIVRLPERPDDSFAPAGGSTQPGGRSGVVGDGSDQIGPGVEGGAELDDHDRLRRGL